MRCPICGKRSNTTSLYCPQHTVVIYDGNGKVISYKDWKEVK